MRTKIIGTRIAATTLATTMIGAGLALPSTADAGPKPGTLQKHANAIQRTGATGVLAQSTGPRGTRYAAAGTADRTTGEAPRPEDAFRIGSATKTFVATVALQLVGEGRLSLDDTVGKWLPGVVAGNGNDGSKITVRQLLQHTSGLFNYTEDFPAIDTKAGFLAGRYTTWTDRQLVAIALRHKPDFAPGAKWSYSNTGYTLVGMIIEKVTGNTWQQEVTRRVIKPLGLRRTHAPATRPSIPGPHMKGYSAFDEGGENIDVTAWNPSAGGAAGAMTGTTGDLTRFFSALMSGRLLRPAQLAEMKTTVRTPEFDDVWPGAAYGLGLMRIPLTCGGAYYGHGGDLPGYSTRDGVSADGRRAVVMEVTGDGTEEGLVTEKAKTKLIDQEFCAK